MAGSAYKIVTLHGKTDPAKPTIETVRGLRPMQAHPWFNILKAQDTVLGGARRVLTTLTMRGQESWNTADADIGNSATQIAPEPDVFRSVGVHRARLTPGSHMALWVIYFPSGGTQEEDTPVGGDSWFDRGNRGTLRVTVTWDLGAATSGPHSWDVELSGQQAPVIAQQGSEINEIKEVFVALMWPPELAGDASEQQKFSEWAEVTITWTMAGGARLVDAVLYEQPVSHVQDHDETADQSAHAYQVGGVVPVVAQTARPQTDRVDGTYQEHRFGTEKGMEVGSRQGDRLGPRILSVTTWHPLDQFPGGDYSIAIQPVITITSSTFVDIFDTARTSWSANNPGFRCDTVNAQLHELCDAGIILRGKKAVIPVRVSVRAEWTGTTGPGKVRVQSSVTEYVDVEFSSTGVLETNEAIGYLEGAVVGDQIDVGLVQIFARCENFVAGDQIEIYGIDVDIGHWARS